MYLMLNFFYAALFAVVNLALEGAVTSTAANISVDDAEATNNITDITATCSSASHDCTNIFPSSTNTLASDPGWLIYTDLLPGHAYQITVNSSTYGGVADKLHLTTITFCTGVNLWIFSVWADLTSFIYSTLIVPTPLEGGGTIYSNGFFFVQSILADRYIHRRELRLVSLESLSSVEYGIKKIFLIFVFDREISRFKLSRK